ncbi:SDR family NAD(P)-dependent oxidoreductase [Methanobrevibacter sp. DSM 116169]|uniref:SDR family NAD(P)-dependent oxidoreductase n=1 Tax=Methanobrevibacter sp. DSM 116169 TaxID=3242727 RepID=UPI0038FD3AF2
MDKLKGKVAIVTGATSGMGRETAKLFAKEGAKVVITGRNEKRAKEVVDDIEKNGGEAIYLIVDMTDLNEVGKIIDKTVDAYGTVDILFNNAGMLSLNPLLEVSLEEWNKVFNVNVTAALILAQKVAPIMKEKGKGVIINTSSIAGYAGHHGFAAYISSKHAMEGLNKSMAYELGPEIRVNAIAPGSIKTAMLDSAGGEEALDYIIQGCTLKRCGAPEDIASVALFLASDDSAYVSGQSIRVDGGYEA